MKYGTPSYYYPTRYCKALDNSWVTVSQRVQTEEHIWNDSMHYFSVCHICRGKDALRRKPVLVNSPGKLVLHLNRMKPIVLSGVYRGVQKMSQPIDLHSKRYNASHLPVWSEIVCTASVLRPYNLLQKI